MPVQKIVKDGKVAYRWGRRGKVYMGESGKSKAVAQGKKKKG